MANSEVRACVYDEHRNEKTGVPDRLTLDSLQYGTAGKFGFVDDLPRQVRLTPKELKITADFPQDDYNQSSNIDRFIETLGAHAGITLIKAREDAELSPGGDGYEYDPYLSIRAKDAKSLEAFLYTDAARSFIPEEGIAFMKSAMEKAKNSQHHV